MAKRSKPIKKILEGEYLSRESVVKNLPFFFFLALIAIIYIANTYYSEKTFKEIEITKTELKELRYRYITAKSILMFESKQVEIARRAQLQGLTENVVPPFKIYYTKDSLR